MTMPSEDPSCLHLSPLLQLPDLKNLQGRFIRALKSFSTALTFKAVSFSLDRAERPSSPPKRSESSILKFTCGARCRETAPSGKALPKIRIFQANASLQLPFGLHSRLVHQLGTSLHKKLFRD